MIITAPQEFEMTNNKVSIFLAGTIDSGNSEDWQSKLIEKLNSDFIIFNPRRSDWPEDSDIDEVEKQIKWELNALDKANLIIMNILPNSKSPISLMEIGMYANSRKIWVYCTEDFYRYTNIKIVCEKYSIPLINSNDIDIIANDIKYLACVSQ